MTVVPVGLGEFKISSRTGDVLTIYGLGSCLGVGMYDPSTGLAGLLHAVLPENANGKPASPKYVNSGINSLLQGMLERGADKSKLVINLVGGANLLMAPGHEGTFNIGERNVTAALETFSNLELPLAKKVVGGHSGRTMRLYVIDGRTTYRSIGKPEQDISIGGL